MSFFRSSQTPSAAVLSHLHRALALHRAGKLEQAEVVYDQVLRLQPTNSEALRLRGSLLLAQGKATEAVASLRAAVRSQAKSAEAHYGLGNALHAAEDLAGAVESYRQALRLRPHFLEAICNLGNVLAAQGSWREAAEMYRAGLAHQPHNVLLQDNLKVAEEQLAAAPTVVDLSTTPEVAEAVA